MDKFRESILDNMLKTILQKLSQMDQKLDRIVYKTSKRGFSLVELMIVVAIIGVLTAIAIPNFQAFQAKSKQSQAKAGLVGLYTAEQAFFSNWEAYLGAVNTAGWAPTGEYIYAIGFNEDQKGFCGQNVNAANGTALGCGPAPQRTFTGAIVGTVTETNTGALAGVQWKGLGAALTGLEGGATNYTDALTDTKKAKSLINYNSFVAVAIGDVIGKGSDTDLDKWAIDENKNLHNAPEGEAAEL